MKKCTPAEKAYHRLSFHNGLLCRKVLNPSTKSVLHHVVVPQALQDTPLQLLHGNPVTAHLSAEKVLKRVQQLCYWPFMSRDIKMWCKRCTPCDARRSPIPHQRAPMSHSKRLQLTFLSFPSQVVATGMCFIKIISPSMSTFMPFQTSAPQQLKNVCLKASSVNMAFQKCCTQIKDGSLSLT